MNTTRPAAVTVVFVLVLLQIAIGVTASLIAAFAPADYKIYAVTTPVFLSYPSPCWRRFGWTNRGRTTW